MASPVPSSASSRSSLRKEHIDLLKDKVLAHERKNNYPKTFRLAKGDFADIMASTGLTSKQISAWLSAFRRSSRAKFDPEVMLKPSAADSIDIESRNIRAGVVIGFGVNAAVRAAFAVRKRFTPKRGKRKAAPVEEDTKDAKSPSAEEERDVAPTEADRNHTAAVWRVAWNEKTTEFRIYFEFDKQLCPRFFVRSLERMGVRVTTLNHINATRLKDRRSGSRFVMDSGRKVGWRHVLHMPNGPTRTEPLCKGEPIGFPLSASENEARQEAARNREFMRTMDDDIDEEDFDDDDDSEESVDYGRVDEPPSGAPRPASGEENAAEGDSEEEQEALIIHQPTPPASPPPNPRSPSVSSYASPPATYPSLGFRSNAPRTLFSSTAATAARGRGPQAMGYTFVAQRTFPGRPPNAPYLNRYPNHPRNQHPRGSLLRVADDLRRRNAADDERRRQMQNDAFARIAAIVDESMNDSDEPPPPMLASASLPADPVVEARPVVQVDGVVDDVLRAMRDSATALLSAEPAAARQSLIDLIRDTLAARNGA